MESSTNSALVAGSSSSSSSDISKTVEETNLSKYFNNEIQREDVCEKINDIKIETTDCNKCTSMYHGIAGILSNAKLVDYYLPESHFIEIKRIKKRAFEFFSRLIKTAIFNVPKGIITNFHDGQKVIEAFVERSCLKANMELSHLRQIIREIEGLSNLSLQSIPQCLSVRLKVTNQKYLLVGKLRMTSISAVTLVILEILPYLGKADFAAEKSRVMNLCSKLVSLFKIEEVINETEAQRILKFKSVSCSLVYVFPWCLFVLHLLNTNDIEMVKAIESLKVKYDAFGLGHFLSAVRILKSIGQKHELFDEGKMTQIQNSFYTFSSQIDDVEAMVNYFLPFQSLVSSVVLYPGVDLDVVEELRMIFSQEIYSRENICIAFREILVDRLFYHNLSRLLKGRAHRPPPSEGVPLPDLDIEDFYRLIVKLHSSQTVKTQPFLMMHRLHHYSENYREILSIVLVRNPMMDVLLSFSKRPELYPDSHPEIEISVIEYLKHLLKLKKILFKDAEVRFSHFTELYKHFCIAGVNSREDKKSGTEKKKARKIYRLEDIIFMNICDFLGWSAPKCHKQYISGSHIPKYFNVDQDKRDFVEAISKNAIRELCKFFGMEKELSSKRKTENSPNELESSKRIRF